MAGYNPDSKSFLSRRSYQSLQCALSPDMSVLQAYPCKCRLEDKEGAKKVEGEVRYITHHQNCLVFSSFKPCCRKIFNSDISAIPCFSLLRCVIAIDSFDSPPPP